MITMFSLSEHMDDTIEFDGESVQIDMSFDNIINVQNLIVDPDEDVYFKVLMTVTLMLDVEFEALIEDYEFEYVYEIFEVLLRHIGFIDKSSDDQQTGTTSNKRVIDFQQDAEAIYASFFLCLQN